MKSNVEQRNPGIDRSRPGGYQNEGKRPAAHMMFVMQWTTEVHVDGCTGQGEGHRRVEQPQLFR